MKRRGIVLAGAAMLGGTPMLGWSQTYPDHPIKIFQGFAPGGNADNIARAISSEMSKGLNQPFVVEAQSGAGGTIAATTVARAKPDGYSLLLATGGASVAALAALLFVFFYGFNVLEASQPSMVSRMAPAHVRGAAMGVYNTLQSLGFFAGGVMGGWLMKHGGAPRLFTVCAALMLLWLAVAWPMRAPKAG